MYQTAPSIRTIGRDQPVILGVPFLSSTCPIKRQGGFARSAFQPCFPCFSESSQASFCPCTLPRVSKPGELAFEPYRYLFCRVPPQPNCPPAAVLLRVSNSIKYGWYYTGDPLCRSYASTLPPILCILYRVTTTSCSKGPQGLRFPLGVSGIFTGK